MTRGPQRRETVLLLRVPSKSNFVILGTNLESKRKCMSVTSLPYVKMIIAPNWINSY